MEDQLNSSPWLLEHQGTHEILNLSIGANSIGRHTKCTFRYRYVFLSRVHAVFYVKNNNELTVECKNTINGVFVNGERLNGTVRQLNEFDIINVGVAEPSIANGPRKTIFTLRKRRLPEVGEIVMISDEEDDDQLAVNLPLLKDQPEEDDVVDEIMNIKESDCNIDGLKPTGLTFNDNQKQTREDKKPTCSLFNDCRNQRNGIEKPTCPTFNDCPIQSSKSETVEDAIDMEKSCGTSNVPRNAGRHSSGLSSNKPDIFEPPRPENPYGRSSSNKSPELHMPLIPKIKQEQVQKESKQIEDLFGEADEYILEKTKDISGYHYNALNRGTKKIDSMKNVLINGEFIDVTNEDNLSENMPNKNNETNINTPIIVVNSDDEEKNNHQSQGFLNNLRGELADKDCIQNINKGTSDTRPDRLTGCLNEKLVQENDRNESCEDKNAIQKDHNENSLDCDEEENFLFSQVLLNDIKEELADINGQDCNDLNDQDVNNSVFSDVVNDTTNQRIPTFSPAVSSETSPCESDEELDIKVNIWTQKLFSQAYEPSREVLDQSFDINEPEDIKIFQLLDDIFENDLADCDILKNDALTNDKKGMNQNLDVSDKKKINSDVSQKKKVCLYEPSSSNDGKSDVNKSQQFNYRIGILSSSSSDTGSCTSISSNNQVPLIEEKVCENYDNFTSSDKQQDIFSKENQETMYTEKTPKESKGKEKKGILESKSTEKTTVELQDQDEKKKGAAKITKKTVEESSAQETSYNEQNADNDNPTASTEVRASASKDITESDLKASSQTPTGKTTPGRNLQIIDAPQLPKHRGKLRGVSAVPKLLDRIREENRSELAVKNLKRKWHTKAHTKKKELKELKEERKYRLKQLAVADNQDRTVEQEQAERDAKKRKINSGQVKAKVTNVNRGALLANDIEPQPSKKLFKIPKLSEKPKAPSLPQKDTKTPSSNSDDVPQRRLHRTMSVDSFSQQLSAPDKLAFQRSNSHHSKLPAERKDAAAARAMRTTNKMTFAAMENFLNAKSKHEKQIDELRSKFTNPSANINDNQIVDINKENLQNKKPKNKKKVRFVDEPIIHYIEPVRGAFRNVEKGVKDFPSMTSSTYASRRYAIRSNYKLVDYSNSILTDILHWSNQWLEVESANEVAANEIIMPMPNEFGTYDHYKSVLFPLMKLEFQSNIERDFKLRTNTYKAELETVTKINDRYLLQTKAQKVDAFRYDLQTIKFGKDSMPTFAYLQCLRFGSASTCKLIFEILAKNYSKEYLLANKQLYVRPVVDNVRIEFGAFNSVYQLQNTPLFNYIIHPKKLCFPNRLLLNRKPPDYKGESKKLNEEQKKTLLETYLKVIDETKPNISLIKGPPGTGKSVLIVNLGLQCLYGAQVRLLDRKILVCSQSNTAIDNICVRFKIICDGMKNQKAKFRVVRFGMIEKMSSKAKQISLQHLVDQVRKKNAPANLSEENRANLKMQEIQLEADISELKKRKYQGTSLEQQLEAKHKQLQQIQLLLKNTMSATDEREIAKYILEKANIVCTTLSSCVKLSQLIDYFDICIIDEATQCTEPWTLLPLKFGMPHLVLVGDTQQLPATVMSRKANEYGLSTSMFARIQNCLEQNPIEATKDIIFNLTTQYRMHPEICKWPNQYFYHNELKNAESTLTHTTPILPYCVIDLKYTTCQKESNGKISNKLEAEFVSKLISYLKTYVPFESNSYGVISPYAQHCETLKAVLKNEDRSFVTVCTVDSYQGLQRDVIIISNARTRGIGFLANYQRLNVALTRSRKNLILCGNFQNLEKVNLWSYLIKDARERNLYFEIEKDCLDDIESRLIRKLLVKNTQ